MRQDDRLLKARMDGSRAKTLLEDETLQAAFIALRKSYSEKLFNTSVGDSAARETLYQAFRVVGEVENHLRAVLDNGKIAEVELNHLIKTNETERKKRFGII